MAESLDYASHSDPIQYLLFLADRIRVWDGRPDRKTVSNFLRRPAALHDARIRQPHIIPGEIHGSPLR